VKKRDKNSLESYDEQLKRYYEDLIK